MKTRFRIVILIFVVIIAAGTYFVVSEKERNTRVPGQNRSSRSYDEVYTNAINSANPKLCDEVKAYTFSDGNFKQSFTAEQAQTNCYTNYAIYRSDIAACDLVASPFNKSKCQLGVNVKLDKLTAATCQSIKASLTEGVDPETEPSLLYCVSQVAKKTKSTKICNTYFPTNAASKNTCVATSTAK
ncbi:MAG: hypothetical protein KBB70_02585 [Candidatus Pacebacteria bacterium]|jgi:hypothetical protein|nr:hypothetical protein [Candidatus Paceibacterota bacterium]